jgi:hypothetical protein
MSENQRSWHAAVRVSIEALLARVEQLEEIAGVSRAAMHRRLSSLEAQVGGQAPHASQQPLRKDDPPRRLADSRGRCWVGGCGTGMTIAEAEERAAALRAETAALRAAKVLYLPRKVG